MSELERFVEEMVGIEAFARCQYDHVRALREHGIKVISELRGEVEVLEDRISCLQDDVRAIENAKYVAEDRLEEAYSTINKVREAVNTNAHIRT